GFAGAEHFMRQTVRPSAVVCANDVQAVGCCKYLANNGYRIPEDVAVVGFDDLPLCDYVTPPLTTIRVPTHFMGQTAAKRLAQIIEEKDALPVKIEISTSLRKRKSV
ncbi:MAG: substrate-binding domain-containing protein, partial [Acutalibacteraceae bacterium]|nr:substrate-binding domain-containing protein [Acutalibacteraceae bacterium]